MPWFIWLCMKVHLKSSETHPTYLTFKWYASLLCQLLWVWRFLHLQTWLSKEFGSDYLGIAGNQDLSSGYNWGLHAWSIIPCTVPTQMPRAKSSSCGLAWRDEGAQYTHRRHKWHSSVPPCSTNQHPTHPFLVFLRLCIDSSTPRCTNYTCKVSLAAFPGPKCWRCNRCLHSLHWVARHQRRHRLPQHESDGKS